MHQFVMSEFNALFDRYTIHLVNSLNAGKVNFTETPESTSGAMGAEATLKCATNGRIERCAWSWRPLTATSEVEDVTMREFPSQGDLGRSCNLVFDSLKMENQGYWTCHVYLAGLNTVMTTDQAKLTVYEEGKHKCIPKKFHSSYNQ